MNQLFDVTPNDTYFYENYIKDFLPDQFVDVHTHVWLKKFKSVREDIPSRTVTWPDRVASENSIEDLLTTYKLLFPDKEVTPLIFGNVRLGDDIEAANDYVKQCARQYGVPALIFASPEWGARELEEKILQGEFLGCKVYLSLSKPYIPADEIRIYDFLPPHQLEVLDQYGWIVMLHIPRKDRLRDPVNLAQMMEMERKYPNVKLIIAHVGRAYCNEDVGNAFEILSDTRNMMFDISANTNQWVFERLIETVGSKRILFGSDLPILRMRAKRICKDGIYINIVPKGIYGDVSRDVHMKEVSGEEAETITFLLYEEIHAFRRAAENMGLSRTDINRIFYENAVNLFKLYK